METKHFNLLLNQRFWLLLHMSYLTTEYCKTLNIAPYPIRCLADSKNYPSNYYLGDYIK